MGNECTPNLFILGAPKCGTTAMSRYLADHPDIFMSEAGGIKEPKFFCHDRWYAHQDHPRTWGDYLQLFADAPEGAKYWGEATPRYLQSAVAVPEILKTCDNPRFVIMLRNPVQLVVSQYNQRVKTGQENKSLESAWKAQSDRLNGKSLPPAIKNGEFLNYAEHASLGKQVKKVFDHVDRPHVHCVFFDDFKKDPGKSYRQLLSFLALPDDGRDGFAPQNVSANIRWRGLASTMTRLRIVRDWLGLPKGLGIQKAVNRLNKASGRTQVRPEFEQELYDYFRDDVALLAELTGRDLSSWQSP